MLTRIKQLFQVERALWNSPLLCLRDKFLYSFSRFTTLPFRKYVYWFGGRFYVDGRLTGLLFPMHLDEIMVVMEATKPQANYRHILEVGANLGQFAAAVLSLDQDCILLSVEPNETILPLLKRNLARYNERWTVIPQAIGPKSRESNFYFVEGKSSQGSLVRSNADYELLGEKSVVKVKVKEGPLTNKRIEEYIGHPVSKFRFVKVDVEGYERNALMGLSEIASCYFWVETIEAREGGLSTAEGEALLTEIFGNVSMSKSYGDNSLFAIA